MTFPLFYSHNPLISPKCSSSLSSQKKTFFLKESLELMGSLPQETFNGGLFFAKRNHKALYKYTLQGQGSLPFPSEKLFLGSTFWILPHITLESPWGFQGDIYSPSRPCPAAFLSFYDHQEEKWLHTWENKPQDPQLSSTPKNIPEAISKTLSNQHQDSFLKKESHPVHDLFFPREGYFSYRPLLFCFLEKFSLQQEDIPSWTFIFQEINFKL